MTAFATRLDASGKIDTTFGDNGQVLLDNGPRRYPSGAEVQRNGKLIASLTPPSTVPVQKNPSFATVRLNADGTRDRSYGGNAAR